MYFSSHKIALPDRKDFWTNRKREVILSVTRPGYQIVKKKNGVQYPIYSVKGKIASMFEAYLKSMFIEVEKSIRLNPVYFVYNVFILLVNINFFI